MFVSYGLFCSKIILLLIILLVFSCSSSMVEESNDFFLSQYGGKVSQIQSKRMELMRKGEKERSPTKSFGWKSSADIVGVVGPVQAYSAFIDTSQITFSEPLGEFYPNLGTLERAKTGFRLPDDMFEIKYNLQLYPRAYRKPQVFFSNIKIPTYDAFGIRTDSGNKKYILVDREALQENIDEINSYKGQEDKEVSLVLIEEQRQSKQRRRLGIVEDVEDVEDEKKESEERLQDKKNGSDEKSNSKESLQKSIGSFIKKTIKKR